MDDEGAWVGHTPFTMKVGNVCVACGNAIPAGTMARFRRWNGKGRKAQLVHTDCLHREVQAATA